jgi:hypothetical protein
MAILLIPDTPKWRTPWTGYVTIGEGDPIQPPPDAVPRSHSASLMPFEVPQKK